jgi:hypothetical protein
MDDKVTGRMRYLNISIVKRISKDEQGPTTTVYLSSDYLIVIDENGDDDGVKNVRVDPVGKGQLLLKTDRVGGSDRRRVGHAANRLDVLLPRHNLLERGAYLARLQVLAQLRKKKNGTNTGVDGNTRRQDLEKPTF